MIANITQKDINGNYIEFREEPVQIHEPQGVEGLALAVNDAIKRYAPSSAQPVKPEWDPPPFGPLRFYSLKPGDWSEFHTITASLIRKKLVLGKI